MKFSEKFNNNLLLFLASTVPFISTFQRYYLFIYTFKYVFFLLLAYYYIFCLATKRSFISGNLNALSGTILLYLLVQIISGLFANDFDLALQKIITEIYFVVIFFIINGLVLNDDSYKSLFNGLLVGLLVSSVIAVLQYVGIKQFNIYSDVELNHNAGIIEAETIQYVRIWGPFGNSLTFSEYLSIAGIAIYTHYRVVKHNAKAALLFLVIATGTLVLTVSRTAFFAVAFSLLAVEYLYARNRSKTIQFLIVTIVIILFAVLVFAPGLQENGNPLISRFTNSTSDFKNSRLNLWIKGYEAFERNILLGVGPSNLYDALSAEGFPMTSDIISTFEGQHVENYYLTILYSLGIIGFFFCMKIYYHMLIYSYKLFTLLRGRLKISAHSAYGGAALGAVVALLINNVTNPALIFDERIKMLFIILLVVINKSYQEFKNIGAFDKSTSIGNLLSKS